MADLLVCLQIRGYPDLLHFASLPTSFHIITHPEEGNQHLMVADLITNGPHSWDLERINQVVTMCARGIELLWIQEDTLVPLTRIRIYIGGGDYGVCSVLVCGALAKSIDGRFSPFLAECIALREGLKLAKELEIDGPCSGN
ncbi:hypothetical protein TIFTF001_048687 [Ficus carica]|uniref:Uncharacterized protein n=1 Tax=Ficus carica TaxID=3494 RepID=A0AA87Z6P9_FICCA|nr:hypothetical protein TIFTF001_048687 [Ficus carica]